MLKRYIHKVLYINYINYIDCLLLAYCLPYREPIDMGRTGPGRAGPAPCAGPSLRGPSADGPPAHIDRQSIGQAIGNR